MVCYGIFWSGQLGCHLEYSIHDQERGSILLRHLIRYPDLASTRFRIHSIFKNSTKLRIRMPDSPNTCGRGIFESGKKKFRIQKFRDTCGRGLSCICSISAFFCLHQQ